MKKFAIVLICIFLISCDSEKSSINNKSAKDLVFEDSSIESASNAIVIDSADVSILANDNDGNIEKPIDQDEVIDEASIVEEDILRKYWDIDSKYEFDESGMLHISPFIQDTVHLNKEVIEEYNYEIEIFKAIEEELKKGRDFSSLSSSELDIYSKYEMGINPWFVGAFCGWSCNNWFELFSSSSELISTNENTYELENIVDGNLATCWSEGAEGNGIGESFSLTANTDYVPRIMSIYNGYSKSEETFRNNNRVKQLLLSVNDKQVATLELKDTMDEQIFIIEHIDGNGENFKLTFEILSIYEGDLYNDTCISDFQIGDGHSRF